MMIWFNLISTPQGKFDSLNGPSDASEEVSYRFLLKWRGSLMLQMVDDNAKWIYQPTWWMFPPRVPNIEVGAELGRDWRVFLLNVGCVRLMLRGVCRVIL